MRSCDSIVTTLVLWYTKSIRLNTWEVIFMNLTPQVVWQIFVTTGSISAYLLYRQLLELSQRAIH